MNLNRRIMGATIASVAFAVSPIVFAAPADDAVARQVEAFRTAQVGDDAAALDRLAAPELTYSHSDGRVEDKANFIKNATAGRSRFTKLEYRNPDIRTVDDTAVVRFNWVGEQTATDGKVSNTNLHVLMVWQKRGSDWRLLARSATRI